MKNPKSSFSLLPFIIVPILALAFLPLIGCDGSGSPARQPDEIPAGPPVQINITVTGIPNDYWGEWGELSLLLPGSSIDVASDEVYIVDGSTGSSFFTAPGAHGIALIFWDSDVVYAISSRNITAGNNTIPFSAFTLVETVSVTVTVTGIPDDYWDDWGDMKLMPRTIAPSSYWVELESIGASATFTVTTVLGINDIGLWLLDFGVLYTLSARNITAGNNTIPFTAFSRVAPVTITITGIPNDYWGEWGELEFEPRGIGTFSAWAEIEITGASATFTATIVPGTYEIWLHICGEYDCSDYRVASRNITAGTNTIPFSAFTPVDWDEFSLNAFTETIKPSACTLTDSLHTRAFTQRPRSLRAN